MRQEEREDAVEAQGKRHGMNTEAEAQRDEEEEKNDGRRGT